MKKNILSQLNILRLVLVFSCCFALLISNVSGAVSDFYSDSEIQFYDPNACDPATADAAGTNSEIKSVYMVGDSITLGAKDFYKLEKKFKDEDINARITASGGAGLNNPGTTGSKKSGIDSIKGDGKAIRNVDAVVIAHGTNNFPDEFPGLLKQAIKEVRKHSNKVKIFWVNIDTNASGNAAYTAEGAKKKNKIIEEKSQTLDFSVIDIKSANIPLSSDGIHPEYDESGFGKWGDTVVKGIVEQSGGSSSASSSATQDKLKYKPVGKIPLAGKKVKASIYGGTYKGGDFLPTNPIQDPGGKNGPSDDPGIGNHDNKLPGTSSYAELSNDTAGLDFSALGNLPNGTKLAITYKGKTVVAEKADVGAGGPSSPKIDLWWEVAKVLDFKEGIANVKVRGVADSTPLTPVGGAALEEEETETSNASCCAEGTSGSADANLSGSNNAEKVFNFYVDKGYTPEQAAGFVGNYDAESGINPAREQDGGNGFGLAQWDDRRTTLEAYAKEKGKPVTSLQLQLDFSIHELDGSESAAKSAIKAVKGSGREAVEQATLTIRERYERPGVHADEKRIASALKYYEQFNGRGGSSSGGSGAESNGGCAESGGGESTGEFEWPLDKKNPVSSCYGYARGRLHTGLDISAPVGSPVMAVDGGVVTQAGNDDPSGFGSTVTIKHKNKKWSLYAHLSEIKVKAGDNVDQGQIIAKSGGAPGAQGAGSSTGPHLHFNIQTSGAMGEGSVDPLKFLPKDGRGISGGDCPSSL